MASARVWPHYHFLLAVALIFGDIALAKFNMEYFLLSFFKHFFFFNSRNVQAWRRTLETKVTRRHRRLVTDQDRGKGRRRGGGGSGPASAPAPAPLWQNSPMPSHSTTATDALCCDEDVSMVSEMNTLLQPGLWRHCEAVHIQRWG